MYRVLLAEDEYIERKYLRKIFEKHSDQFEVVGEALNGNDAVKKAGLLHPDIIIMDINMAALNGLEAARAIKDTAPTTIIILNTAFAEFEFARLALEYKLDGYLLKPSSETDILASIEKSIRSTGSSDTCPNHQKSGSENIVTQVQDYVDSYYSRRLSLEEIAQSVHFSPAYISSLFRKETGMTITDYIRKVRLSHALTMLEHSSSAVGEIAKTCGFFNISHFNRVFKKYTGNSPMELRKKMHADDSN